MSYGFRFYTLTPTKRRHRELNGLYYEVIKLALGYVTNGNIFAVDFIADKAQFVNETYKKIFYFCENGK